MNSNIAKITAAAGAAPCKTGGLLTIPIETANKCVIIPQSPPKKQKLATALPGKRNANHQNQRQMPA
jgi:hypothetical protein